MALETGQIRDHTEVGLCAAQRQPKAGPHLVEDQHGPVLAADVLHLLEETVPGRLKGHRLQDDAGCVAVDGGSQ
jgi:hypothetical protein